MYHLIITANILGCYYILWAFWKCTWTTGLDRRHSWEYIKSRFSYNFPRVLKNPLVVNIASTIYQHMNVQGQDSFKKIYNLHFILMHYNHEESFVLKISCLKCLFLSFFSHHSCLFLSFFPFSLDWLLTSLILLDINLSVTLYVLGNLSTSISICKGNV